MWISIRLAKENEWQLYWCLLLLTISSPMCYLRACFMKNISVHLTLLVKTFSLTWLIHNLSRWLWQRGRREEKEIQNERVWLRARLTNVDYSNLHFTYIPPPFLKWVRVLMAHFNYHPKVQYSWKEKKKRRRGRRRKKGGEKLPEYAL